VARIGVAAAWTLSAAFRPGTIYLDGRSDDSVTNPLGLTFLSGGWLMLADERAGPHRGSQQRLFDIDVIISNTLTYAMLTAFVAGLYGGVTTLVQRLSSS